MVIYDLFRFLDNVETQLKRLLAKHRKRVPDKCNKTFSILTNNQWIRKQFIKNSFEIFRNIFLVKFMSLQNFFISVFLQCSKVCTSFLVFWASLKNRFSRPHLQA